MKRTTISLPDNVSAALEREARRRRVPVSQVVRELIEKSLSLNTGKRRLALIGIVQDPVESDARDFDEYLVEAGWAEAIENDRDS